MKILTEEEQVEKYFLKTCEELHETHYHSDPRMETDSYEIHSFNKEKAKKLFNEMKNYFTK